LDDVYSEILRFQPQLMGTIGDLETFVDRWLPAGQCDLGRNELEMAATLSRDRPRLYQGARRSRRSAGARRGTRIQLGILDLGDSVFFSVRLPAAPAY